MRVNCESKIMKRTPVATVLTLLTVSVLLSALPNDTHGSSNLNGPFVLVMSPSGHDANDGKTDSPIRTLSRAQDLIRSSLSARHMDVEVRIRPGVYKGDTVVWTFTMPANKITFMPFYDDKNRPVFDGRGLGKDSTWFDLRHSAGESTNLHFRYLRVENYATAINFRGNRERANGHNGSNLIHGSYFRNIGADSTAAVRLVNSRNNQIINNHFVDIRRKNKCGLLHALYIAHMSSGNQILRNRFKNNCGDPVRIRDYSNNNFISGNKFENVGVNAAYTEWFCDKDSRSDCTKKSPECPSWNNQVRDNQLNRNSAGGRLKAWKILVKGLTKGCDMPSPTRGCAPPSANACRLRTSGNQYPP